MFISSSKYFILFISLSIYGVFIIFLEKCFFKHYKCYLLIQHKISLLKATVSFYYLTRVHVRRWQTFIYIYLYLKVNPDILNVTDDMFECILSFISSFKSNSGVPCGEFPIRQTVRSRVYF